MKRWYASEARTANSFRPPPTRRPSLGPATRVAPTAHVGHTSSIAKSKEMVMPWYTRSEGCTPYNSVITEMKLQMLDWAMSTPLGRPEDPEV